MSSPSMASVQVASSNDDRESDGKTERSGDDQSERSEDDQSEYSEEDDEDDGTKNVPSIWEISGMIHDHFEPSHSPKTKHLRYLNKWQVDYELCEPHELKHFVVARGLADPYPSGVTLKYLYIRVLEHADAEWTFDFMGLPPEMRLLVYKQLLSFVMKPGYPYGQGVYPHILSTSKQVHREAKGALYEDNTIEIELCVEEFDDDLAKFSRVHNLCHLANCCNAPYVRIPYGIDDYPEFLHRITRLEITLDYAYYGETNPIYGVQNASRTFNALLYTLASFLMDGHCLKHLSIIFVASTEVQDRQAEMIFYPLRRLRNVPNITMEGDIPDHVQRIVRRDLNCTEPSFNTLRYWKLLAEKAIAQLGLIESTHGDVGCSCGECEDGLLCSEELNIVMSLLQEVRDSSGFNSQREENLLARLARVRAKLADIESKKVYEALKVFIEKTSAVSDYEAISDEGRLDEAGKIWQGKIHNRALMESIDHGDWDDHEDYPSEVQERLIAADEANKPLDQAAHDKEEVLVRGDSPEL